MIGQATTRVALWGGSALTAASLSGVSWAMEPIEVPIMWLLVLTFVPTSDLKDVVRSQLSKLESQRSG